MIDTISSLSPLTLPPEVADDRKQLKAFMTILTKTINKLIRGVQKLNNMTAE